MLCSSTTKDKGSVSWSAIQAISPNVKDNANSMARFVLFIGHLLGIWPFSVLGMEGSQLEKAKRVPDEAASLFGLIASSRGYLEGKRRTVSVLFWAKKRIWSDNFCHSEESIQGRPSGPGRERPAVETRVRDEA